MEASDLAVDVVHGTRCGTCWLDVWKPCGISRVGGDQV